ELKAGGFGEKRTGDGKIWDSSNIAVARSIEKWVPADIDLLRRAGLQISEGIATADSIDDFLQRCDQRPDAEAIKLCGKLAIARTILDAERHSDLYVSSSNIYNRLDLNSITNTWFMKLFRLLTRNHLDRQTLFDNVSFINFNYDRCLEYFFLNALMAAFAISAAEAINMTKAVRIFHPYGTVGVLPALAKPGAVTVEFGTENADLLSVAAQIRTYSEQIEDQSMVSAIRAEIRNAQRIIFLGFAYHAPNMKLITPQIDPGPNLTEIHGTALKFSDSDCAVISNYLSALRSSDGPRQRDSSARSYMRCTI
ncbi:MAG: hypothetical protein ACJ8CS_19920, partial [Microvirga sp.]